jgi:hypothetical protein
MFIREPNMTPRLAADPPLRMRGSSVRTSTSQPTRPSVGAVMKGGYRAPVDPRPNTVSRRPRSLGVSGESEKGLAQIAQGLKSDQAPTYPAGVAGRGGHGERHRRRATAEREVLGIARRDEPRPPAPTAVQAARGGCAARLSTAGLPKGSIPNCSALSGARNDRLGRN